VAETGVLREIRVDPVTLEAIRLWTMMLALAADLGPDREWSLIGGLMVQLHGFEHEDDLRPTVDIDLLAAAKRKPAMTEQIASILVDKGAEIAMPPRSKPGVGYRFELEGEVIEILGPDGLRADPKTVGALRTFGVSGGSQALVRTEPVLVRLADSPPVVIRRPTILGAILIKARVVARRRKDKFDSDRQDLIRLLTYVEDPRALAQAEEMKPSERKWLRNISAALAFNDPALQALFGGGRLERAEQAFQLLSSP
jgi:hypothetical protein